MIKTIKCFTACLLSVLCCGANAANWNIEEFTINEDELKKQDIQTFEKTFQNNEPKEGETKGIMGVLLIKAPYDVVWDVISNWEAQGEFVPGLEYFKVKHVFSSGSPLNWHSLVEGQLDIPFVSFRYTLDAQFDKEQGTMVWNMLKPEDIDKYKTENIDVRRSDEERLKNIAGFGQIKSFNDTQTVYYYAPIVEVSAPIPGFVEDIISKVSLGRYLEAIKEKAEEVHQRAKLESPKRVADTADAEFE